MSNKEIDPNKISKLAALIIAIITAIAGYFVNDGVTYLSNLLK